ncbi:MEX3C isoform 4, partial [Pongo abelii]
YGGDDAQGMMAAMLSHAYGPGGCGAAAAALNGEQAALLRRKSVNTTECVPVPSSEHVAEIVGRQGECRGGEVQLVMAPGVGGETRERSVGRKRRTRRGPQVHREGVWEEPRVDQM